MELRSTVPSFFVYRANQIMVALLQYIFICRYHRKMPTIDNQYFWPLPRVPTVVKLKNVLSFFFIHPQLNDDRLEDLRHMNFDMSSCLVQKLVHSVAVTFGAAP
jgi:hypothetical protein